MSLQFTVLSEIISAVVNYYSTLYFIFYWTDFRYSSFEMDSNINLYSEKYWLQPGLVFRVYYGNLMHS